MEAIFTNIQETVEIVAKGDVTNLPLWACVVASIVGMSVLSALAGPSYYRKNLPVGINFKLSTPEEDGDTSLGEADAGTWEFLCGADEDREQKLNIKTTGTKIGRSYWKFRSSADSSAKDRAKELMSTFNHTNNVNSSDLIYRQQKLQHETIDGEAPKRTGDLGRDAAAAAIHGSKFYSKLQTEQGYWPGDYGGPMFLLPGLVIACHVTGVDLGARKKQAMLRYLVNHQQADGGWGTHIEGQSTMFGSCLNYVAARLLGLRGMAPEACRARLFIRAHGGAVAAPQWAKFWMAILGVYEWDGCNPVPPELWLLPNWFPFHPGRMWCHARMVYLPMSAVFGARFVYPGAEDDMDVLALREELYCEKYEFINWARERETIAAVDVYSPQSTLMYVLNAVLYYTLENPIFRSLLGFVLNPMRRAGLKFAFEYIVAEDFQTNGVDIGPVNKAMNMVAVFADRGPDSDEFKRHVPRVEDYLWIAEDGMKMQGYNGSQLWDTGFAATGIVHAAKAQVMYGGSVPEEVTQSLRKAHMYMDDSQVQQNEDNMERYYRHISKGGWPFSTQDHGWPISDCTAEGLKTCLLLEDPSVNVVTGPAGSRKPLSPERYDDAANVVLSMHNASRIGGDGGWASYELNRGWDWYEQLNPAIVFGDIMIDYSYVECSSACIQSLVKFGKAFPDSPRMPAIQTAVEEGARFILSKLEPNGAWYGSWAVCFTYGAWFGCEGLGAVYDFIPDSSPLKQEIPPAICKAVKYLFTMQAADGGWGESIKACGMKRWVPNENEGSQVVNTAWALLSLVRAAEVLQPLGYEKELQLEDRMAKAVEFLMNRQLVEGDWAQESVSGVFNKSCAITYTAYRNAFPIWALGRFAQHRARQDQK